MGKGTIISGGIGGEYSVEIAHRLTVLNDSIAKNTASLATVNAEIAAETDKDKLTKLKLTKASLLATKKYLDDLATKINTTGWCVDVTETMTGTVGTIEVPGERKTFVNLYSDNTYTAARDGQLEKAGAGKTAGVIWNLAMLPGWQKWKPTYRYGTITALTISDIEGGNDTCDVTLEAAVSTQQDLNVNQGTTLSNVPIDYMDCNGAGFIVGDVVVVKFTGQDWNSPVVIGYKKEPKYCHHVVMITVSLRCLKDPDLEWWEGDKYFAKSAVIVWDAKNNKLLKGPVSSLDADFIKWYSYRDVISSTTVPSSVCGTVDYNFGCLDMAAMMLPEGYTQPSGCQILVPGGEDFYKWFQSNDPYPHVWQYHIQAANDQHTMYDHSIHPKSAYVNAVIGDNEDPTIVGIRTKVEVDGIDISTEEIRTSTANHVYTYYTPLGGGSQSYTIAAVNDVLSQEVLNQPLERGFDFKLRLAYTKNVFINICVRQHMRELYPANDPNWQFHIVTQPREIYIEGNALYDRKSIYDVNWIAAGRNSAFEAAVKGAIEMAYTLNNITDNYVREAKVNIQFLR